MMGTSKMFPANSSGNEGFLNKSRQLWRIPVSAARPVSILRRHPVARLDFKHATTVLLTQLDPANGGINAGRPASFCLAIGKVPLCRDTHAPLPATRNRNFLKRYGCDKSPGRGGPA